MLKQFFENSKRHLSILEDIQAQLQQINMKLEAYDNTLDKVLYQNNVSRETQDILESNWKCAYEWLEEFEKTSQEEHN